jgi:hypothetical protein
MLPVGGKPQALRRRDCCGLPSMRPLSLPGGVAASAPPTAAFKLKHPYEIAPLFKFWFRGTAAEVSSKFVPDNSRALSRLCLAWNTRNAGIAIGAGS